MSPGQALELGATFGTFSKFLHGVEPGWLKDLPATVRIIVYYAVGTMALEIAYGLVRALLKGLGVVSERLASLFGRSIVYGYGELAQSIGRWVIVSQGWQQDVTTPWKMEWLDNKLAVDLETPVSRDPSSRNTPRLVMYQIWDYLLTLGLMVATLSTIPVLIAVGIVRGLLRLHLFNAAGLIVALWYAGILNSAMSNIFATIGRIPVGVLLAVGTILAAMYSAFNVDIRGRAELNKTASVNCRLLLLKTTPHLMTAANALSRLGAAVVPGINAFPTAAELADVTGRNDLAWRGGFRLLPRGSHLSSHLVRSFRPLVDSRAYQIYRRQVDFDREPSTETHSLVRLDEVKEVIRKLEDARAGIEKQLDEILESGLYGKLERTLGYTARTCMANLAEADFGVSDTQLLVVPNGQSTFSHLLGEQQAEDLRASWREVVAVDLSDERIRRRCRTLAGVVDQRTILQRRTLWRLHLSEARLRYLAAAIDSSLKPGVFERIREFYGK